MVLEASPYPDGFPQQFKFDNLAVIKPTFMGAAPRIFEKAHARIVTTEQAQGGLRARLFDRLVFSKVREVCIRLFVSGAAPLNRDIGE